MSIPVESFNYRRGLRRHLLENNITFTNVDGIITFNDEATALTLITAYSPLSTVRAEARVRILAEAAIRVSAIYPHIEADTTDIISFYNYTTDMYSGSLPLPTRLQALKDVHDTAVAKIAEVGSEADYLVIEAYDATVGW